MNTRPFIRMLASGACLSALAIAAIAAPATAQTASDGDDGAAAGNPAGTIVVTATKRTEPLDTVAASITAVTAEELDDLNAQSLSDYITRVPGVVFNEYQPGVSEVVIRGIASTTYHEANQATTGYYLNQIPLVEPGFPIAIPDVDTFDLAQVEVLRGPQGTLFGSSSLGGAVNYVVNEARTDGFDAGFEGILSSTRRAGEASYAVKGMVNVPIIQDKLAVRLVALERYDAGYLDNTGTGVEGSNDLRVRGLRGSIVFTPTETTTISALSMYQEYRLDDQTYVLFGTDPEEPTFTRATNVPEFQNTEFQLHSLRLDQELGSFATLTAIGSYIRKENDLAFDDSIFVGIDPRTDTAQLSGSTGKSETYYGELRLASPEKGPFTWLIGTNYTQLKADTTDGVFIEGIGDYIDANPDQFDNQPASVIAPGDLVQRTRANSDVREIALFGEASYTFLDTLTLTLGGRLFQYTSEPRLQFLANAALIPPFDYQPGKRKEDGFIPKVSLRWQPSESFMIYGLYSEGFRIGGINVYSAASGTPLDFDSDSTRNFEIGTRIRPVPGMSFDITAYHIDWDDIQVRLFTLPDYTAYTTNGGGADIDGIEFQLAFEPAPFLSFTSSAAYNDAKLSELLVDTFAAGGGYAAGTRLPGASEWTIANQLEFRLPHSPLNPRFGIAHRYLSAAPVAFGAALEKGDYNIVDLNASFDLADNLEIGAFVKNAFDQYGILNAPFSFAGSVVRPRTVGASIRFDLQ